MIRSVVVSRVVKFLVCLVVLSPVVMVVQPAEAGVLLKSQTVRSRVRTRTPQVRLGYKKASTWVSNSRRNNPINTSTLTSRKALDQYERSWDRYARDVKRFEARRVREAKRTERREEQQRKRELKAAEREAARQAQQEKRKAKIQQEQAPAPTQVESQDGTTSPAGDSSSVQVEGTRPERANFWSKFWQRLIGKSSQE